MKLTNSLGHSINNVLPIKHALKRSQVSADRKLCTFIDCFKCSVFNSSLCNALFKEAASQ